jgi:zinc transporter 5/7
MQAAYYLQRLRGFTSDQRKLFVLVLLLAILTQVEYFYGFVQVDVQAVADGVQATMHIAALVLSISAIEFTKRKRDEVFSYGYERVETLAAFTNCCLILFECVFGFMHQLHDAFVSLGIQGHAQPVPATSSHVQIIGICRCGVNLLGLALFSAEVRAALRRSLLEWDATLPAHNEHMAAMVWKLLSSASCSIVAIASSGAEGFIGQTEMALSLLSGAGVVYLSLPPLISSGRILLLALPAEVQPQLHKCLREVSFADGVLEVLQWYFWPVASDRSLVGAVSLRVRSDADEDAVRQAVHVICSRICCDLTVQVVREQPLDMLLAENHH